MGMKWLRNIDLIVPSVRLWEMVGSRFSRTAFVCCQRDCGCSISLLETKHCSPLTLLPNQSMKDGHTIFNWLLLELGRMLKFSFEYLFYKFDKYLERWANSAMAYLRTVCNGVIQTLWFWMLTSIEVYYDGSSWTSTMTTVGGSTVVLQSRSAARFHWRNSSR